MKMIEIKINKDCQAWGQCVFDAPEIFSLVDSERKKWSYKVDDSLLEKVEEAKAHCPNRAISFEVIND
jgi:ferredoxin